MRTLASRIRVQCAGALALLALGPAITHAQFTEPPPPAAYALRNVTLVTSDGTRTPGVTIVVRDDFIQALGSEVAVPADARVLAGDGLFVYPGLIDAYGSVDVDVPRDSIDRREVMSWDPTREAHGFRPHRRIADFITATGDDAADLRKDGVVAVGVHPTEGLMPGQSALVLLRPDAASASQLIVDPALGPVFTLHGRRGFYPSTVMGTFAWYRQTFLDAARHTRIAQAARTDARGIGLPAFDRDYAVLNAVIGGNTPVWFMASEGTEILQALRLADELEFSPVIVGGLEAWKHAGLLARRDVAVLASLDFTEPEQWKPEGKDSASTEVGVVQERRRIEEEYRNAGLLADAGVRFALVSGGGEADLLEGARKAIAYGLDETEALRALTATPAALLGAPSLARVEHGMPANLLVTDGPLFDEDTKIRYTFVNGGLEVVESESGSESGSGGEGEPAQVAGTWEVEVDMGGAQTSTLTLTQDGSEISGTMQSEMGTNDVSGTVTGNEIEFTMRLQFGNESVTIEYGGTVEGDTIEGEVSSPMGNASWTARRTAPGAEDVR